MSDFGLRDQPLEKAERYSVQFAFRHGRKLIAIGLLSMLVFQGCEMAGIKQVQRYESGFALEQQVFANRFDPRISQLETEVYQFQSLSLLNNEQTEGLRKTNNELATLRTERAAELSRLESQKWSKMRINVHEARANYSVWSYYRQMLMMVVTLCLATGLLGRFYAGQSAERWLAIGLICVMALAVLLSQFMPSMAGK